MRKYRSIFRVFVLAATLLAAAGLPGVPVQAAGVVGNGTAASCTQSALVGALIGGGSVTFNCGGAATILISSTMTISADTTIDGGGNITLDGGGTTKLFLVPALTKFTLNNITLTRGNSSGNGGALSGSGTITLNNTVISSSQVGVGFCGGAIATDATATIVIANSTLQTNSGGSGGAICTSGNLQLINSNLIFNKATNSTAGYGGAIYLFPAAVVDFLGGNLNGNSAVLGGGIYMGSNTRVTMHTAAQPVSVSANSATDSGGAIYNDPTNQSGNLLIDHADFIGNTVPANVIAAGFGGAIADRGAAMTVANSVFNQNQGRFGGALFIGEGSGPQTATVVLDSFDSNTASVDGGGLYTDIETATVNVTDATFTNNSANFGGGLARFSTHLTISDSSFTTNNATSGGGGVEISAGPAATAGGYVEIKDSTIANNTAPQGGGIYNTAEVDLGNITIAGNSTNGVFNTGTGAIMRIYNTVLQNPSPNCNTATLSSAGGNYATDTTCNLTMPTDTQGTGLNAMLGSLTNDGGTSTYYELPAAGSPLINHAVPPCSATDQRHATRPDACDIGAVEFGGRLVNVTPGENMMFLAIVMN